MSTVDSRGRREMGTAASSQMHPPHATAGYEGTPLQADHPSRANIPSMPANASGQDKITTAEHDRGIDDGSMYDKRPAEDKNQPPSSPAR